MRSKTPRSKLALRKTTVKNLMVLTEEIPLRPGVKSGPTRAGGHPDQRPGAC